MQNKKTLGRHFLSCDCETRSPKTDLITLKLLLKRVIITTSAKHVIADVKIFCFVAQLENKQHVLTQVDKIPEEVIEACNLHSKRQNNF